MSVLLKQQEEVPRSSKHQIENNWKPDISLCPDLATFARDIDEDEEMFLDVHSVLVASTVQEGATIDHSIDVLDHILGYGCAVTARSRPKGGFLNKMMGMKSKLLHPPLRFDLRTKAYSVGGNVSNVSCVDTAQCSTRSI
jgi:hypothetical protein